MKKLQLNTGRLQLKKSKIMELTASQASRIVGGTGPTFNCTVLETCVDCGDPDPGGPINTGSVMCAAYTVPCPPPNSGPVCVLPPQTLNIVCAQLTNMGC